jgi:hypothetical protein
MVLLEGAAVGALATLGSQPELQRMLVFMMVVTISAVTILVIVLISGFAIKSPGLLFNPRDIDPSAHQALYAPNEKPRIPTVSDEISFTLTPETPPSEPDK